MTLTAEQIETRRHHIGSSDAAAICGIDPYKSPADVYTEKILETDDITGNEAIDVGNLLEPVLLDWAAGQLGRSVHRAVFKRKGILAANLDGVLLDDEYLEGDLIGEIIEAKTTGITEGWGDPDVPNDVPEKVLVQTHHQLYVTGAKIAYVPVLIGDFGLHFRLYRVERNDDLAESVASRCTAFWNDYVEKRIAPPDSLPSLEVATRIRRVPNKIVTSSDVPELDQLVGEFEATKVILKDAKDAHDGQKAALLTAMGDAEELRCDAGVYTYFEQTTKAHMRKESTFRVLRAKKPKRR